MNACPACMGRLEAVEYENLTIYQCELCEGYLVSEEELRDVAEHKAPLERLEAEAEDTKEPDSREFLHCPCCTEEMVKEVIHGEDAFTVDACKDCRVLWFDGGELPRLRLLYEEALAGDEQGPTGPALLHALLGDAPFRDW